MGILSRFKDIMESNINAMLDKVEDPEKMIEQMLRNLNKDLSKVKEETASVMAAEKRAERELNECKEEIAEMMKYATRALQSGNEGDARSFLSKKAFLDSRLVGLQGNYDVAKQNAEQMRAMHDKLVGDIDELENRKSVIKGKLSVAKAQSRMNKITSSSSKSANSSISAFERYEAKAEQMLDQANAMAELNAGTDGGLRDLKEKYTTGGSAVDDELAALKASLGM